MSDWTHAVKHYAVLNGHYPENLIADSGEELSWRIKLLDRFEGPGYVLKNKLTPPWDKVAIANMETPHSLYCPGGFWTRQSDPECYFAIVGNKTIWDYAIEHEHEYFIESGRYDAVLIEARVSVVGKWYEPKDVSAADAVEMLCKPKPTKYDGHLVDHGILWRESVQKHVGFADGSVRSIKLPIRKELAEAIVYADIKVDWDMRRELDAACRTPLDYKVCLALPVFLVLALFPLLRKTTIYASSA